MAMVVVSVTRPSQTFLVESSGDMDVDVIFFVDGETKSREPQAAQREAGALLKVPVVKMERQGFAADTTK